MRSAKQEAHWLQTMGSSQGYLHIWKAVPIVAFKVTPLFTGASEDCHGGSDQVFVAVYGGKNWQQQGKP